MAGNPCAEIDDFLTFVAAFLPQITYYQYKLIPDEERIIGLEEHSEQLRLVELDEAKEQEIQDKIEAEIAEAELHAGSFVEFLGSRHLFDQMFDGDEEGAALLTMNTEVKQFYSDYEEQFITITKQIFEMGQKQYQIRKTEVDEFFESITTAKIDNQQISIDKMEEFLLKKTNTFEHIKNLEDDLEAEKITLEEFNDNIQKCADEYNDIIHHIWKDLMGLELTLYEQMEEVIQNFEQVVTEQINIFIEAAQGYFTELRSLEQTYIENISVEAHAFQTMINAQEDFFIPDELTMIMSDKEALVNALGATHDSHMLAIDTREDRLTGRAKTWLSNLVGGLTKLCQVVEKVFFINALLKKLYNFNDKNDLYCFYRPSFLQRDEIERNRGKVLEINHFLDIQREEFDELHAFTIGNMMMMDPDLSAALN